VTELAKSISQLVKPQGSIGMAFEEKVERIESIGMNYPQAPCPVIHRFGPGVYIREVKIPAGVFAIGHHQNFEHMNIFLSGRLTMLNEDGTTTEMIAPVTYVAKPGRKISFSHEDVVWINVYATDEQDIEKLEKHYLTKSASWLEAAAVKKQVQLLQQNMDRKDFLSAIESFGLTEESVKKTSFNEDDMIPLPFGSYKIKVANSALDGKGLFATGDLISGEKIAPARIAGKRTIAGRYTNHSAAPNAKMVEGINGDIDLVATRSILGCHGGLDGEEITIDYRESIRLTREIGSRGLKCLG
jgi:hypothetical protein